MENQRKALFFLDGGTYNPGFTEGFPTPSIIEIAQNTAAQLGGAKKVFTRVHQSLGDLIRDAKSGKRVDALMIDVVSRVTEGIYDFTYGGRAYAECIEKLGSTYQGIDKHIIFLSPVFPQQRVLRELGDNNPNNPHNLGSRVVLYGESETYHLAEHLRKLSIC